MIYDCFTINHELDMLEIRLNVLNSIVDKFVIVEASRTHTGKDKPFYFDENKSRFNKFSDKIIHIKLTEFGNCKTSWDYEHYQRDNIMLGLTEADDDDIIMISDIDEIPNPKTVMGCKNLPEIKSLHMENFVYYLNNIAVGRTCTNEQTTKILFMKDIRSGILDEENSKTTLSKIKFNHKKHQIIIPNGGWHFTSCYSNDDISIKFLSNAYHDNENELSRNNLIINCEKYKNALCLWNKEEPLLTVKFDDYFPEYLLANKEKYINILKPGYGFSMKTIKIIETILRKTRWTIYHFITMFMKNEDAKRRALRKLNL